jgi:hypothetical protein
MTPSNLTPAIATALFADPGATAQELFVKA